MNKKICNKVIENRAQFVPTLFTERQVGLLEKYLLQKRLSPAEKTYLYTAIRRKIEALSLISRGFYQYGQGMIPERARLAKKILEELGQEKAFISGSFLFSPKYKDIDIYVISERRKEYHDKLNHFIHLTYKDLEKPLFQSAAGYCISTFEIQAQKPIYRRMKFNDLVLNYETAVVEILDKEDEKTIRDIVFEYNLHLKKILLNSFELHAETSRIRKSKDKIELLNSMVKELLLKGYSRRYIYDVLVSFVKQLESDINEFRANENLIIYRGLFDEVKNECRRAESKA